MAGRGDGAGTIAAGRRRWTATGRGPHAAPVRGIPPVLAAAGAFYVGAWAPSRRAESNLEGGLTLFLVTTVVGMAIMAMVPRSRWWLRALLAVAVGGAVLPAEGRTLALWSMASVALAVWTFADRPPVPVRSPAPGAELLVLAASWEALRVGPGASANWQPLAVLVLTGGVLLVTSGWVTPPGRLLRSVEWAVERVVQPPLVAVLALLTWLVRVVVAGVVGSHPGRWGGWLLVRRSEIDARSAGPVRPAVPVARGRVVAASLGLVALVVGGVVAWPREADLPVATSRTSVPTSLAANGVPFPSPNGVSARDVGVPLPSDPIPAAFAEDRWYRGFRQDLTWVFDERVAWRPLVVQRVLDVKTPTVNVKDRRRATWTPPACESCRRLTVWMYGGTGAFGLGQRDDHTVASELARAAADAGVVLDVQNRGIPGMMHWRNATRLAWDLTQEPAPDLVVFYEGAEEIDSEMELRRRGLGNVLAPFESFLTNIYDEVAQVPDQVPEAPAGARYVGWPRLDDRERPLGHLAVERFVRSRQMSDDTARQYELPVRYVWQPSRFDAAVDAPASSPGGDDPRALAFRGATEVLPDDVIDLTDTLADQREPVFADDTTHNERAARVVGRRLWEELRDDVAALPAR